MSRQEFAIRPPDPRLMWLLPGLALLAVLIGTAILMMREPQAWIALPIAFASFTFLAVTLRRRRVSLSNGTLIVTAGLNTRRVAIGDLDLSSARIVDLREHHEWKPSLKLFGTRVPGLSMGHFRLRDRNRAFVLLTDPSRVLVLTEYSGRRLLLSVTRPQALLDALQKQDSHRR
ncbi:MAG TPA: PH domain-containing protein [Lysobacter sp.]|jgi:hypothetical protein|nr:PH domain-containing protein [Lysobacter sp.]